MPKWEKVTKCCFFFILDLIWDFGTWNINLVTAGGSSSLVRFYIICFMSSVPHH